MLKAPNSINDSKIKGIIGENPKGEQNKTK